MNEDTPIQNPHQKRMLVVCAWVSILLISDLPDILYNAIFGEIPDWLMWGKVCFLALFLALTFFWKQVRPLLPYVFVMLVLYTALIVSEWVRTSAWWVGLIDETQPSFFLAWLRAFVRDTGVALAVIAALWIVKRRRNAFFLTKGQLDAPIEPVLWLGIGPGESWRVFGLIFAFAAALLVALPTFLAMRPSLDVLLRATRLLPTAVLLAIINAFNEEMYFRASLLSTLPAIIGKNHALLINVAFFGLAHYLYGSPPGILGFLMTGFLAWLLGKSMLETKGLFWPWFIHFLPDVVIFFSYAIDWVQ
ncbi:MAG: CPBP family intramembrane metalloprotease [Anaerolineae bacterium]|nr:CPBP family intramembrane metalloprotease [Anaerolineae bacterium]